jgi:hypothetical protein
VYNFKKGDNNDRIFKKYYGLGITKRGRACQKMPN